MMERSDGLQKYHPIFIGLGALMVLLAGYPYLWTGGLHAMALSQHMSDQVGYVTAARNLAEHGRLESNVYYPALAGLYKSHNILYMPGSFYIRAFFFRLFGYSTFTAILPNLFAYVLSSMVLFVLMRRMSDTFSAWMTAAAFMLFPPVVLYAFSAMTELVFICAVLAGVYLFIRLPVDMRHTIGVLAVLLPYLIRDSAIFLLPGLAVMIYLDNDRLQWKRVVWFALLCGLGVLLLKHHQFIADLPPLYFVRFISIDAIYTNANILQNMKISLPVIMEIAVSNGWLNLNRFVELVVKWPVWSLDFFFVMVVLGLIPVNIHIVCRRGAGSRKIGLLGLFIALAVLAVLASVQYYFINYNGIRHILFAFPFLFGAVAMSLSEKFANSRHVLMIIMLAVIVTGVFFLRGCLLKFNEVYTSTDVYTEKCIAEMDGLGIPNNGFFVAPYEIGLDYVQARYPVRWSFIPDNEETLQLLAERYSIDMILIPIEHRLGFDPSSQRMKESLAGGRFIYSGPRIIMDKLHLIYLPASLHQN